VLFEESIADTLDRYVDDQRMKDALYGQGVIGAWAGPRDPGTASIKLMHYQGDLGGQGPLWGFVEGGMGQISFAIAQAARDLGATLATGVPVAEIVAGEGVRLEGGELIRAGVVVSNADPRRTLGLVDPAAVPAAYRERIDGWQLRSPVVKLNAVLHGCPPSRPPPGAGSRPTGP
jgi:phytoene dehydrogenase-like protein